MQRKFGISALDLDQEGRVVRRLLKVELDNGDVAADTFPTHDATKVQSVKRLRRCALAVSRAAA